MHFSPFLPRLSSEGVIHWLHWNSRIWSSSDIIVMLKSRHHMKLHLSLFRDFWKLISKLKNSDKQEKESNLNFKGKIENHVPRDHSLSSLGKSCDAKR